MAGREAFLGGHDCIDQWSTRRKIIEAAGLDAKVWGVCPTCKGHAIHPDDIAAQEAWDRTDPPAGDGWQLWETISEGSPITPVFATAEELARHLAAHEGPTTYEQWLRFVKGSGWAPTFIGDQDGIKTGVEALVPKES